MLQDFTALDLETTGLNPKTDKIIEIGAIRIRDGKEAARWESLVNPGCQISNFTEGLTGIRNEELMSAPAIEEVLPALMDFLMDDVLVGHQILFDYSFLKKAAVNQGIFFDKKGIDTLKLARKFLPQLPSRRLSDLCCYYGIETTSHRAGSDALSAAMLYERLVQDFPDEEAYRPSELVFHVKRESPASKKQKERLYCLLEWHKIIPDYDVERLTRNEASRITDKIILAYGRLPHP